MASLTIPFPEGTRTIQLRGTRITIGRLPDNVIQIRDRTVSAYHAELILEGDHYRIHDTESTNGVLVGGQKSAHYHLHEDCDIVLGGLECRYSVSLAPGAAESPAIVPTHGEMQTLLQANADLRAETEALRTQVTAMQIAREAAGNSAATAPLEHVDQLAEDARKLRESLQAKQTQIDRLTNLLSIVTRERDTLQRAYDDARAAAGKPTITLPQPPKVATMATPVPSGLPKPPPGINKGSPSRRPASGVQAAGVKSPVPVPRAAGGMGPKGTQKLAE